MRSNTSKSGLFLLELILSVLFFSLSSVICVQMFVKSHNLSKESKELNNSVILCESMADTFYATEGDLLQMTELLSGSSLPKDNVICMFFDEAFNITGESSAVYKLSGTCDTDNLLKLLNIELTEISQDKTVYTLSIKYYPSETDT